MQAKDQIDIYLALQEKGRTNTIILCLNSLNFNKKIVKWIGTTGTVTIIAFLAAIYFK